MAVAEFKMAGHINDGDIRKEQGIRGINKVPKGTSRRTVKYA
jgi:hypothetical protein